MLHRNIQKNPGRGQRIVAGFRKKKETSLAELPGVHDEPHRMLDILPSVCDGPKRPTA